MSGKESIVWSPGEFAAKYRGCSLKITQPGDGLSDNEWNWWAGNNLRSCLGTADDEHQARERAVSAADLLSTFEEMKVWSLFLKEGPVASDKINMADGDCLLCGGMPNSECLHSPEEVRNAFKLLLRIPRS